MSKTMKLRNAFAMEARSLHAHRQESKKSCSKGGGKNSTRELLDLASEQEEENQEAIIAGDLATEHVVYDVVHFEKDCWCGYKHPTFPKEEPIVFKPLEECEP